MYCLMHKHWTFELFLKLVFSFYHKWVGGGTPSCSFNRHFFTSFLNDSANNVYLCSKIFSYKTSIFLIPHLSDLHFYSIYYFAFEIISLNQLEKLLDHSFFDLCCFLREAAKKVLFLVALPPFSPLNSKKKCLISNRKAKFSQEVRVSPWTSQVTRIFFKGGGVYRIRTKKTNLFFYPPHIFFSRQKKVKNASPPLRAPIRTLLATLQTWHWHQVTRAILRNISHGTEYKYNIAMVCLK